MRRLEATLNVSGELWFGPAVWAVLYVSDYASTIACARLYRAQDKVVFEGSYEITPIFQADVDALRRVSPRFVGFLLGSTAYLSWLSYATAKWGLRDAYWLVLGALVLLEMTIHLRHVRNWYLFSRLSAPGGPQGRIEYPRAGMLRASAVEFLSFTVLYACLSLATGSVFILGGVLTCGSSSIGHYRLARRHEAKALDTPHRTTR